jgi:peptide-methionine (S)-S-oxide reductase
MDLVTIRMRTAAGMLALMGLLSTKMMCQDMSTITLGGGCFWCIEAVFSDLKGVESAVSGYMGGHIKNPAYREVCTGRTGHAEVVQVSYDASTISLDAILDVFLTAHDPTQLNRQGADVGTQYRSCVFYSSDDDRAITEQALMEWNQKNEPATAVTQVSPVGDFFPAEDYHQQYYELNGEAPYCRAVIAPKLSKVRREFAPLFRAD